LQFRARLNLQATQQRPVIAKQDEPLHPALIATVLAWGAKFSEHPLLVADRERNDGQSQLAKALIDRTRELAESLKVHRIPNPDHVVISLLIEPLQCRTCGFLSTKHLLNIMHQRTQDMTPVVVDLLFLPRRLTESRLPWVLAHKRDT